MLVESLIGVYFIMMLSILIYGSLSFLGGSAKKHPHQQVRPRRIEYKSH